MQYEIETEESPCSEGDCGQEYCPNGCHVRRCRIDDAVRLLSCDLFPTHWHVCVVEETSYDGFTQKSPISYNKEQAERKRGEIEEGILFYPRGNRIKYYPYIEACSGSPEVCPATIG